MKRFIISTALAVMAGTFAIAGTASADPGHRGHDRGYERGYDRHYDRHDRHDRYDNRRYYRGYDRGYHRGWRDRSDWRRGGYVSYNDWHRGYYVDYRRHHLRRPPYGYEWRRVDDNYVLAAVATGLIASVIIGGY
ncbi:MAG: RcnB family protein [Asticcacaulis sp.]|nr:RcnB family protein [Asticcacaulis sp.]